MAIFNAKNLKCDWEALPYKVQLHHPIHKFSWIAWCIWRGNSCGGSAKPTKNKVPLAMAVQSLRIKSHLQWVLKEMDTSINMQSILWPPSRLVVNSSLLYDYNSSRKSMFLVSPLISVTGNLLHSFNCMDVTTSPHWLMQILMREHEAARDGTKTT